MNKTSLHCSKEINSALDKTVLSKLTVMLQWKTGRSLARELLSVEQNALPVFFFLGSVLQMPSTCGMSPVRC